jgi:hypothetical protein
MDHDLLRRHEDFLRDNQLRRELDAATPSIGPAGLIIAAAILVILAIVYFGPSVSNTTNVASRDATEAPAPIFPPTNP